MDGLSELQLESLVAGRHQDAVRRKAGRGPMGWMLLDFVGSWDDAEADWLGGGVYG